MIHDIDLVLSMVPAPVESVAAVGVGVFGGHEDVANARIEFEDGCVANLTASRASFQAVRKMRLCGPEGYVTLDFAAKHGTIVRPSDRLRRGEVDLDGLDLAQPAAVKERIFGKILRVDQVQAEGREPLALELEDFVQAVRTGLAPAGHRRRRPPRRSAWPTRSSRASAPTPGKGRARRPDRPPPPARAPGRADRQPARPPSSSDTATRAEAPANEIEQPE